MEELPLANHRLCTTPKKARHNTSINLLEEISYSSNDVIVHTIRRNLYSTKDIY